MKKWKIKTEYKVLETTEGTSAAIIAALRHFYQDKDAENLEITLLSVNTADNIPEWKGLGGMVVR